MTASVNPTRKELKVTPENIAVASPMNCFVIKIDNKTNGYLEKQNNKEFRQRGRARVKTERGRERKGERD